MSREFEGKTIFITGAAKGQGRAVAIAFAQEGANIIAFDLGARIEYPAYNRSSNEDLEKLKSDVEAVGGKILIYAGDVRKASDVKEAVDRGVNEFGGIDILFSNAGIAAYGYSWELTEEQWDALIEVAKSQAIELAPYGIRVVTLHPTGVNTPMNDGLAELEGTTAIEIAERSAGNLLKTPWIETEDIVEAVKYIASDKARYMTGNQFVLDAGLLTR